MNVCAGVSKKPRLDSELAEEAEQKMAPKLAELHAARDRTEPNSTERHYANSEITRLKQGGPKEYCDSPEAKLQRSTNCANQSIAVSLGKYGYFPFSTLLMSR